MQRPSAIQPWRHLDGAPGLGRAGCLRDTAPAARQRRAWTPADGPMPALFLSHGAPPLFDDAVWIEQLFGWAQALPKPSAVLIVSAHWESAPLSLSASAPAPHWRTTSAASTAATSR